MIQELQSIKEQLFDAPSEVKEAFNTLVGYFDNSKVDFVITKAAADISNYLSGPHRLGPYFKGPEGGCYKGSMSESEFKKLKSFCKSITEDLGNGLFGFSKNKFEREYPNIKYLPEKRY